MYACYYNDTKDVNHRYKNIKCYSISQLYNTYVYTSTYIIRV